MEKNEGHSNEGQNEARRERPFYLSPLSIGGTMFVIWMNALQFASTHEEVRNAIAAIFCSHTHSTVVKKPTETSRHEETPSPEKKEEKPKVSKKPAPKKTDEELLLEQTCRALKANCEEPASK